MSNKVNYIKLNNDSYKLNNDSYKSNDDEYNDYYKSKNNRKIKKIGKNNKKNSTIMNMIIINMKLNND